MGDYMSVDILVRWLHVMFGVAWVGLLYYFNFIQGEYFKEADPAAKADATQKLVPRALKWFRWSAMFTFLTGLYLLHLIHRSHGINSYIVMGALMGILMFLNVWLIIWPKQKIVCGMVEGDIPSAAAKALLASRTNTLFSAPMLLGMLGSYHGGGHAAKLVAGAAIDNTAARAMGMGGIGTGLWIVIAVIILLEINAVVGKLGPMRSVVGVVHISLALALVFLGLIQFV